MPYVLWRDRGFITATPGNVIDYDYIEQTVRNDADKFDITEIAYDRWNSTEIINHLSEDGLELVPFGQGYISMNPASKDFEKKVLGKEINNGQNPIMKWMISCTEVKTDAAGNIKPIKPDRHKTGKRIDGVVASIMALDRAVHGDDNGSVYDKRGVRAV